MGRSGVMRWVQRGDMYATHRSDQTFEGKAEGDALYGPPLAAAGPANCLERWRLSAIIVRLPHVLPVVLMVHKNLSAILDGIAALLIGSRIALVISFRRIEQAPPSPSSRGSLQRIAS